MSSGQTPLTSTRSRVSSEEDRGSTLVDGYAESELSKVASVTEENNSAHQNNSIATLDDDDLPRQKHRPRSSGGFLLQPLPAETIRSSRSPSTGHDISEKAKGKRKAENGDLIVPKRGSARQRHRQKTSLGSSPLVTEISNAHAPEHVDALKPKYHAPRRSQGGDNIRSSVNSNGTSSTSEFSKDGISRANRTSAFGHDTDPGQIVNLALNLSESRRRNFSTGGLVAHRDSVGVKRLTSTSQAPIGLPYGSPAGSLKQYLNQQRRISRNVSPRSGRSASSQGASPQLSQQARSDYGRTSTLPSLGIDLNDDIVFNASDATLARAEKARVAIELSYEYRRLLQWLPKLPTPTQSKSNTSKGDGQYSGNAAEILGRAYNPLQYIRNRKVRFKEDKPLDSEAQGWTNVENTRSWVDTVIKEREVGISRVDSRFPLPSFDPPQRGLAITDDAENSGISPQPRKIARPHNVWEFASWDLLADAYWLNHDDNATRIEDSHGKKLFTDRQIQQEYATRTSKDSVRSPERRSESLIRANGSPEKIRTSFESLRSGPKDRGRRWREKDEPRSPISDDDGSQFQKSRWSRRFVRSRSPSSSGESYRNKRHGHVRGTSRLSHRDDFESAALEKHMMDMLAKEAEDDKVVELSHQQVALEPKSSQQITSDNRTNGKAQYGARRPSAPQRLQTDMPISENQQAPARASLDEERFTHQRMSSDDLQSTAPNSPTAPGFVPSIAINLSPPASPQTSAISNKKILSNKFSSLRRNKSPDDSLRVVSDSDFALESSTSTDISRQTTNESQLAHVLRKERSTDPSNGLLSPSKSDFFGRQSRHHRNSISKSVKDANASDSRLRSLFKGSRIAEIVGSEVSRVGDRFWRRDSGNINSQVNSPSASTYGSEDSDMDDGDVSGLDNSPENDLSRAVSRADGKGRLSQGSTNSDKPRFYMNNLPTFRSTFNRDEPLVPTKVPSDHDHITRQQMAMRERGRSSRFDRLAPPKIDMRGISRSRSRSPSPEHGDNETRHSSSSSRSGRRVRSADRRLNAMLNTPGKIRVHDPAPTGLSSLASHLPEPRGRPTHEVKRQWSISDRSVSTVRGTITKRDIARVRALLLSSGVKANEIVRRADEILATPSPFLQDLQHLFQGDIPHVPRSQEYIVAGRMLISNTETNIQKLRDSADEFSHRTVESLHDKLKAIDHRVNYELTPLVRAAADDADAFSTELTTTHTLAVKQLNDSINAILRRRRRRLRWIRRVGWTMLEWTLLGIMWLVWFIVVIIQLVRRTMGACIAVVRWLLWL